MNSCAKAAAALVTGAFAAFAQPRPWYLDAISLPDVFRFPAGRPIRVAVIDDAFRLTHEALRGHLWTNPGEIPDNGIDDDGNGYVDDVHGWDVADDDPDVSPPTDRLEAYSHGTRAAGLIAAVAEAATPRGQPPIIEIIPVKCLSDQAGKNYLMDAYKAVEYALRAGADVINCSWGGGPLGEKEKAILAEARKKGVLVIASAGNFSTEAPQFPAAAPGVFAVAALDSSGRKYAKSNYGAHVSLSAPGENLRSPSAASDTSYELFSGTSASAPLVSAVAALGLRARPGLSPRELEGRLANSAASLDPRDARYAGKLGAGKLDAGAFLSDVASLAFAPTAKPAAPLRSARAETLVHPRGTIFYGQKTAQAWRISPSGSFAGFRFFPAVEGKRTGRLTLTSGDTIAGTALAAGPAVISGRATASIARSFSLDSLPEEIFIAGSHVNVEVTPGEGRGRLSLAYVPVTVDSSRLFCKDEKFLAGQPGVFTDGSGAADYAGNSDCKWLITAPEGKRVRLEFSDFDTEARVDQIYVFDGEGTQERIIGLFSGSRVPPVVVSSGRKLLVWFVTDDKTHGRGWEARYGFTTPDAQPGSLAQRP